MNCSARALVATIGLAAAAAPMGACDDGTSSDASAVMGDAAGASGGSAGADSGESTSMSSGGAGGGASASNGGNASNDGGLAYGADAFSADAGGSGSPGLPEVGSEGDGDRTIGPSWVDDPLIHYNKDVPQSRQFSFDMQSAESAIYPGINGPFQRKVTVYVPAQYVAGKTAPFMVAQDAGAGFEGQLATTVDNLSAMKKLPALVTIFVANGGGDKEGSERGLEYDTVSGLYADFVDKEVLPRVVSEAQKQLDLRLILTSDPNGRGTFGASSGGAAAFSMAWWHPDLFRRVLSYSGSLVSQVPEPMPFPHGCWVYHDVDPHFIQVSDPPHGLILGHCWNPRVAGVGNPGPCDTPLSQMACEAVAGCTWSTQQKPVRVWIESGDRDDGTPGFAVDPKFIPAAYGDFNIANQRMAAAFAARGYPYHYDHAVNAYHSDGRVVGQTLPEAMQWLWRGYPTD